MSKEASPEKVVQEIRRKTRQRFHMTRREGRRFVSSYVRSRSVVNDPD